MPVDAGLQGKSPKHSFRAGLWSAIGLIIGWPVNVGCF
jgi:hypothetical protein